jgi:hypothetical protein
LCNVQDWIEAAEGNPERLAEIRQVVTHSSASVFADSQAFIRLKFDQATTRCMTDYGALKSCNTYSDL